MGGLEKSCTAAAVVALAEYVLVVTTAAFPCESMAGFTCREERRQIGC